MLQCLLCKILRLLRVNTIIYNILKRYFVIVKGNNSIDVNEAYKQMSSIYPPKQNSTCLCNNSIDYDYDLHLIVPVYNVEKYIIKCIESILLQNTHFSYYVTIVNDGSTDNSRKLLERYESTKNIEIIDQDNKGLSGARNAGLQHIKGRYVSFIDSDDYIEPNFVETLLSKGFSEQADIVEGSYNTFSNKRAYISTVQHKNKVTSLWNNNLFGVAWGKIFKSTLFQKVHFPESYWFEDTLCSIIIFPQVSKIITIDDIIYNYRINDAGITSISKGNIKSIDSFWITYELIKEKEKIGLKNDQQDYEFFLNQIKMCYTRTKKLRIHKLNKLMFSLYCQLFDNFFSTFSTHERKMVDLENSLKNKNYKAFILYLLFK